MARTIIYREKLDRGVHTGGSGDEDGYKEKLAKFVPAEVLGPFLPLAAQIKDHGNLLAFLFVVGFLLTPIYLYLTALSLDKKKRPPLYFYLLAALAFAAWAFGASSAIAQRFGIEPEVGTFLLGLVVFAFPAIDGMLAQFVRR